jgi:hypothetical protein
MLYQLPNGRVVYLSTEQYLDLTDEDIQALVATGSGEQPTNPFFGSVINSPRATSSKDDDDFYNKDGLDYDPDDEETDTQGPIDLDSLPDESIT